MAIPSVSAILPAWNARAHVCRALDSVLAQTLPVAEIVLADDGSTDGTADAVEARYGTRVRVLRLPRANAARARVEAVRASRGEWIAFLDADDCWLATKTERQLDEVRRHPGTTWLASDGVVVEDGRVLRASFLDDFFHPVRELRGDLYPALAQRCFVLTPSVLVRRSAYDAVGGMDAGLVSAHDYDLWLRLAAHGPGALLPDRLVTVHRSAGSLSTVRRPRLEENIALVERLRRGHPRRDPDAQHAAARRLTALYWSLGLLHLREGGAREARRAFRAAAAAPGPVRRRLLALAAALVPGRLALGLRGSPLAREVVRGAQDRGGRVRVAGGGAEEAGA